MRRFLLPPAFQLAGKVRPLPFPRHFCLYTAILLLALSLSVRLDAQEIRPLDKKIDYRADSVSLTTALHRLKELSGLHITFNEEQAGAQPRIVLKITASPVRLVLEKILERTNLQFIESPDGDVLIIPRKKKSDPVKAEVWIRVNGQVVDPKGIPLPNATIQIPAEQRGVSTDAKGMFEVSVVKNGRLRFSYLGRKTVEQEVKIGVFMKIVLDTAPAVMNEYVVNGYQTVDKRLLASSTFTLKPEEFLEAGIPNLTQMLQGKVPGLMIINNSGSPNATPTVRLRGTSTIMGNASPLWVVDGVIKEDPVNLTPLQVSDALQGAQASNFSIVGNAISGLNPYDIESLTFLKDASATAIYGVRAANGVIVVTTKRGKSGQTSISYNVNLGFVSHPNYNSVDAMNSKDRIGVSREMKDRGIFYTSQPLPQSYEALLEQLYDRQISQADFTAGVAKLETMNTNWFKILSGNNLNQQHSLSFSGGAGKSTYYTSFSYADQNGTYTGDKKKLYTVAGNLTSPLSKRLMLDVNISGYMQQGYGYYQGINPQDYALNTSRAISADSPYVKSLYYNPWTSGFYPLHFDYRNELAQTGNTSTTQDLTATANLSYRILPGLRYSALLSGDASANKSFQFAADRSYTIAAIRGYDYASVPNGGVEQKKSPLPFGGIAIPANTNNVSYTVRNTLQFDRSLFSGRDQFSLTGIQEIHSVKTDGFQSQELGYYPDRGDTYYSNYYNAGGGMNPGSIQFQHSASATNTINNTLSWAAIGSYSFNRRYTLNLNFRTDGSNRFGQYTNQKFLPAWSVAGRWDLGDEPWMVKSDIISGLDLRASYGIQGNVVNQVGPNLIASYPTSPLDPATSEYMLNLASLPYPNLRWEKTATYNVGLDLNLFNQRVTMTVDGYYRKSTNLLVSHSLPQEYGVAEMYENFGNMDNGGLDASLRIIPIRTKDFEWTQSFIYSLNFNKVAQVGLNNQYSNYLNGSAYIPGKPIGSFWSYKFAGLNHDYGFPQFANTGHFISTTTDPASFLVYSGRSMPLINLSSSSFIRYKSFTLNAEFTVFLGAVKRLNSIYNGQAAQGAPAPDQNLPKELNDRWRNPGDELKTNIPGFSNWLIEGGGLIVPVNTSTASPYSAYDLSDARVVSSNFLRCKYLSVNYSIPAAFLKTTGIHGAGLSASVSNPFILDSRAFRGQDPEISNTGGTALPIMRSWTMSMNINF